MKATIIYISHHGTTERVAKIISDRLSNYQTEIVNLKKNSAPDITDSDLVILGASIHAGQVQKKMKTYCNNNLPVLKNKKTGLFISRMFKDHEQVAFENAFPEELRNHSSANSITGGELLFDKMNLLEKLIVKKVAKIDKSVSEIDYTAIENFTNKLNNN